MALQHRYPLRHLGIADLPFCNLDAYLAKVGARLWLDQWHLICRIIVIDGQKNGCSFA